MSRDLVYPNDTIQEALCEFRLKPSPQTTWTAKTPGEILKKIGLESFPGMEPITDIGFELTVDETGQPRPRIIQGPQKFRFSSDDGSRLVQISPAMFSFNAVGKYPGWHTMKEQIVDNWKKVRTTLAPQHIERIGLRYINRIPLSDAHSRISDWLKPNRYVPEGITQSRLGSKYRLEARISERDIIIVTIVDQEAEDKSKQLFLDIDLGVTMQTLPTDDDVAKEIERLHNHAREVFDATKSDLYEAYLLKE